MPYKYDLTLDEFYFRTLIERYYRQKPIMLRPRWQFGIFNVAIIVALPFFPFERNHPGVLISMYLMAGLISIGALALIRLMVYQKFRYTSYFGRTSSSTLLEEGLQISGLNRNKLIAWSEYESAVQFSDGIMLLRKGIIWWLPDAALRESRSDDVMQFLSTKMRLRSVT